MANFLVQKAGSSHPTVSWFTKKHRMFHMELSVNGYPKNAGWCHGKSQSLNKNSDDLGVPQWLRTSPYLTGKQPSPAPKISLSLASTERLALAPPSILEKNSIGLGGWQGMIYMYIYNLWISMGYVYIYTHWLVVWNMTGLWDIYIMCDIKAVAVYVIHCNTVYRYTYIYMYLQRWY